MRPNQTQTFIQLHEALASAQWPYQNQHRRDIINTLKIYTQLVVNSDKQETEIFDIFCELRGLDILKELIPYFHSEIMESVTLMLININRPESLNYIMAHPILAELISSNHVDTGVDEFMQQYVAMLKSLCLRLDSTRIPIFYNKKHYRFPLAYESSKLYNYPDSMVSTTTNTILFNLAKISNTECRNYFCSFPFTIYYLHHICLIRYKWLTIDQTISRNLSTSQLLQDQKDTLLTLLDMLDLLDEKAAALVERAIIQYLIKPLLMAFTAEAKGTLSITLSLYLLIDYLSIFKNNRRIIELICIILFSKKTPKKFIAELRIQPHIPKSFAPRYKVDYYWDQFPKEIQFFCNRTLNSSVPSQHLNQHNKLDEQFIKEVEKISRSIGTNILTGQVLESYWLQEFDALSFVRTHDSEDCVDNPINQVINSFLKTKDDKLLQLITKLLIYFIEDSKLHHDILAACSLLAESNYQQNSPTCNIKSLTCTYLGLITSQLPFSISTLNVVFYLLGKLLQFQVDQHKQLEASSIKIILDAFEKSLVTVRKILKGPHSLLVPSLVQPLFKYPYKELKSQDELCVNSSQVSEEGELNQILFMFNCLRKLRYNIVKKSRLPSTKSSLQLVYAQRDRQQRSSEWHIGKSIQLSNISIVMCFEVQLRKPVIMVYDPYRFVLVREHERNSSDAVVLANCKHKNLGWRRSGELQSTLEVNIGDKEFLIEFENEYMFMRAVELLNFAKNENLKEEVMMLSGYVQDCLSDLKYAQGQ